MLPDGGQSRKCHKRKHYDYTPSPLLNYPACGYLDDEKIKREREKKEREYKQIIESEVPILGYEKYVPPFAEKTEEETEKWEDGFKLMDIETEPLADDPVPELLKKKHRTKKIDGKTYYLIVDPHTKEESWCYYETPQVVTSPTRNGDKRFRSPLSQYWFPKLFYQGTASDRTVLLGGPMEGSVLFPVTTLENQYKRGWLCVLRKATIEGKKATIDHEHYVIYDIVRKKTYTYEEAETAHLIIDAGGKDLFFDEPIVPVIWVRQDNKYHRINTVTGKEQVQDVPKWESIGLNKALELGRARAKELEEEKANTNTI